VKIETEKKHNKKKKKKQKNEQKKKKKKKVPELEPIYLVSEEYCHCALTYKVLSQ